MAVKYVLVARIDPARPTAPRRWYALHTSAGEVPLRQLARELAARSTLSPADVTAVLEGLLEIIPEKLAAGQIVRLGDFGSFTGTVRSKGVADPAQFRPATDLLGLDIRFRPGKELARAVATVSFEPAEPTSRT